MASLLASLQASLQSPSIPYQPLALGLIVSVAVFESYIGSRQKPFLSPILSPAIPASLLPYLISTKDSLSVYHKSQLYAKAKMNYASALGLLDLLESFILFSSVSFLVWDFMGLKGAISRGFPFVGLTEEWSLLKGFWDLCATNYGGEITQSLVFVILLTSIGAVLSAPKGYYSTFVLEQEHGFNKSTKGTWIKDQFKNYFLSLFLEVPIIAGVLNIIEYVGPSGIITLIIGLMTFILTFQLIMIPLYPLIILPLFNTLTPLKSDNPVYPKVKALATRLNFPLNEIWVIDGSKRSAHSNAFYYGVPFLSKSIVIYDTLLEKSTPEEIEAILGKSLRSLSLSILVLISSHSSRIRSLGRIARIDPPRNFPLSNFLHVDNFRFILG